MLWILQAVMFTNTDNWKAEKFCLELSTSYMQKKNFKWLSLKRVNGDRLCKLKIKPQVHALWEVPQGQWPCYFWHCKYFGSNPASHSVIRKNIAAFGLQPSHVSLWSVSWTFHCYLHCNLSYRPPWQGVYTSVDLNRGSRRRKDWQCLSIK